jgi:hypothetical protein
MLLKNNNCLKRSFSVFYYFRQKECGQAAKNYSAILKMSRNQKLVLKTNISILQ